MMSISNFFTNGWANALGWTLLHSLWQSMLVLLIVMAVLRLIDSRRSALRYTVISAGYFAFTLLAFATFLYLRPAQMPPDSLSPTVGVPVAYVVSPVAATHPSADFISYTRLIVQKYMPLVVCAWAIGFMIFAIRLCSGFLYTYRIRSTGIPVEGRWEEFVRRAADRVGIDKFISLSESATITAPVVIGYFKPVILIPMGMMSGLTTEQLETVILHELAHIRRHDYIINLIQSVVETIFFFNPFVWVMSKLIRREREYCCDDLVVRIHGSKKAYAYALTQLAEAQLTAARFALSLGDDKNQLLNRIKRIMEKSASNYPLKGRIAVPLILLVGALLCISWLGTDRHNPPTHDSIASQDTVTPKKPNVARYSRKSIITLDENGQPHEDVVEEFEGDESLRALLEQHAIPSIAAPPPVPGVDAFPPIPGMKPVAPIPPMPSDTIPFGFNSKEWESMTKSFEDLQRQLGMLQGFGKGDSTLMMPGLGKNFSFPDMEDFQFPDRFFENLGDLDRSEMFENLQENLRHLEDLQRKNFGDLGRQFQRQTDRMGSYERQLRDQLERDGYLSTDEPIQSLEWNNDSFKVNGKKVKPDDREKYRKLNDQFFGEPDRPAGKGRLQ